MSQSDKAAYYAALKASGVTFSKHYREYTTEELLEAYHRLQTAEQPELDLGLPTQEAGPTVIETPPLVPPQPTVIETPPLVAPQPTVIETPLPPVAPRPVDVLPGSHVLSVPEGEPIRVDEQGLIWYQEEVTKPSFPKPRGRRVLKYLNPGVETKQIVSGQYIESFEVAGNRKVAGEIKITLPSYQVGIFRDPSMPFKIHVYNGQRGFNLFEVEDFYGGADMVPSDILRIYVENVLCYDIRTVVRSIQNEYRQRQLQGGIKE